MNRGTIQNKKSICLSFIDGKVIGNENPTGKKRQITNYGRNFCRISQKKTRKVIIKQG